MDDRCIQYSEEGTRKLSMRLSKHDRDIYSRTGLTKNGHRETHADNLLVRYGANGFICKSHFAIVVASIQFHFVNRHFDYAQV
jgi:hypothetical protein